MCVHHGTDSIGEKCNYFLIFRATSPVRGFIMAQRFSIDMSFVNSIPDKDYAMRVSNLKQRLRSASFLLSKGDQRAMNANLSRAVLELIRLR